MLKKYKSIFKIFTASIGDLPFKKITNRLMEQYITEIFKKSKHQARGHYAPPRSAFNKAISWRYLSINPRSGIRPQK